MMDQRQFFLRDILTVVFKRRGLIITVGLLVVAVTLVFGYMWPPSFESEASVQISHGREVSQADTTVMGSETSMSMIQMSVEDLNSEIEILLSEDVMRNTVESLGLDSDPFPYEGGPLRAPFNAIRFGVELVLDVTGLKRQPDEVQRAMDELRNRLTVNPVRDSYVLDVALQLGTPEKSQEVLAAVLEEYKAHHIVVFNERNEDTIKFFEEQVARVGTSLKDAQDDLQQFRDEKKISLLETEEELLLEQYAKAQQILTQLKEVEQGVTGDSLDSSITATLSSETDSTVVREMQLRLLELILEQNRVVQTLGPNHPTVQSLEQQVRNAQGSLIEAIANVKVITQAKLDDVQARLQELGHTKMELDRKQKSVDILTENFETYLLKQEESLIADKLAEGEFSNVRTISNPTKPSNPVHPNRLINLILAIIGGGILGLALAFFLDYLDHGLKTPEDVEVQTGLVPLATFFNKGGETLDKHEAERLSVVLDTYSGKRDGATVFQVTSSVPGEGGGAVADALSKAYGADPHGNTLLIDFSGEVAKTSKGITDVLTDQVSLDSVFSGNDGLTVVGRGSGDYPAFLWGSDRMGEVMKDLRRRYKHIVLNVGPVLSSHDALKLSEHADGVVMVVKADATRYEVVERAVSTFGSDGKPKLVGAVLTGRTQSIPQAVYRRI